MANDLHFQRYFEVLQKWLSPDELDKLRRELGSPEQILEDRARVQALVNRAERRDAVWAFLRTAALAFVSIVGLLATMKAILPAGWLP